MKKRDFIFVGIIICIVTFSVYQYKEINKLNSQVYKLLNKAKHKITIEDVKNKNIKLKEGIKIDVFDNYKNFPSVPAYGPLCTLNAFGINTSNAKVKIIGKENKFFTRVSIEGLIPTWTIEENIPGQTNYDINNKIMYILDSCDVFLSPTDDSISVFSCDRGNAVTVKGEYRDWYYINLNCIYDANSLDYGWIKKHYLGYYDKFNTNIGLQVNLKKGSPMRLPNSDKVQIVENHITWGTIYDETNNEYTLLLPGAAEVIIEKKYVEPFSIQKQ